jgi:hypothetical protein
MKIKKLFLLFILSFILSSLSNLTAQDTTPKPLINEQKKPAAPVEVPIESVLTNGTVFDDTLLLEGFTKRYMEESADTLFAIIQDETLDDIKVAAAVKAFRNKYALKIFSREKESAESILLRQFNRSDSAFISVEIMHTLCLMDRYKYFNAFIPQLMQKLDHYNSTINASAYKAISEIIEKGNNRAREARIVFNSLRKTLFLSRRRLAQVTKPDERLAQKLTILKWSIKVLGSQELKRLPKEVLNLL